MSRPAPDAEEFEFVDPSHAGRTPARRRTGMAPHAERWTDPPRSAVRGARSPTAAVGYLRRSTDRQEQSIPDQRRALERFAAEQGLRLLRWYTDDAISGTSALARKAFQRLIADAQSPACDFSSVLVYDVKRFGRLDNDEAGYYRHLLRTAGVQVLYASEGFNGGETDDLLRPVKQWQARQESKDLSKVTIRGLLSKGQGGWWLGGVPPHGDDMRYENERGEFLFAVRHMPDGSKQVLDEDGALQRTLARGESLSVSKRDRAKLMPGDPQRVQTVREIFRLYVEERKGLSVIAAELNRRGVPTPRGSAWSHIYAGHWRDSTVRAILVNPLYAGDMVWNRCTDARFHSISDGRAQAIREGRPASAARAGVPRPVGGWSGARARFILSGLVRCAACGGRYQGVTRTKGKPRKDGTKVRTYSYGCGSYIAKGTIACAFNPVPQRVLEEAVVSAVLEYYKRYEGPEGRQRLVAAVREALGVEAQDLAEARRRVEAERRQIESAIARLLDNLTERTRDLAEERLEQRRERRIRLEQRAEELERLAAQQGRVQDAVREAGGFLAGLEFTLREGSGEEKTSALRRCVREVWVDPASRTERAVTLGLPGTATGPADHIELTFKDLPRVHRSRPDPNETHVSW